MRVRSLDQAYTLIEIMVILAILGISLSVVAPLVVRGLTGTRYKAGVRDLAATFRYARSMAISYRTNVSVELDIQSGKYQVRIYQDAMKQTTNPTPEPDYGYGDETPASKPHPPRVPRERILPDGMSFGRISLNNTQFRADSHEIVFYSKGNCTGGTIELEQNNNPYYILVLDPITGLVRMEKVE